ncbi:FAD-dependent oxidoreductase [Hymenobacter sp. CRA2]|uniref:FAD-dependent oxidoreductase n=1 Tax=Hymenobacter sp. CRA2 TaxID=1955620 RepID=UPI00098EA97B|nr:FAD-dependent oxidoreductase [Hymenobacter sp. CRA2]OON66489.1 FAD-dependent oxidoreductase [Hymenobacter sp. CRA2]
MIKQDAPGAAAFSPGRRDFVARTALGAAGLLLSPALLDSCAPAASHAHIQGGMRGANFSVGHLLRDPTKLPAPSRTVQTDVLIIGGGVSGLAAKRWLARHGRREVLLVELEAAVGGNAAGGRNGVSAYPWGAHYLPVPDVRNRELLEFLQEAGTITGFAPDGLPIYSEYHLCHDPEERLLIHGHWQSGLVPELGVPAADREQISRFFGLIDELRQAQGADGRDAFAIPLDKSSADPRFRQLDALSFADYLDREGYTSPYLRWYLDYGCKDDYGATAARVSAWAGLHYFASRKGRAHNATHADVLTWPEGNGFLVEHLRRQAPDNIHSGQLAYDLRETPAGVSVLTYDVATRQTTRIEARQVLLATPYFVTRRLLAQVPDAPTLRPAPYHAPWVIANLTVDGLPQGPGQPLSWDNVQYGSAAVGYIDANHQDLGLQPGPRVMTYYCPLAHTDPDAARREAYQTSYEQWLQRILAELETAHPGITPRVQQAEVWVWGHGMVAPTPGYVWGGSRATARQPLRHKLFFAHTDLSGISLFEEAFYQGIRAATEMLLPA